MTSLDSGGKAIPPPPVAIPASSNGHASIAAGAGCVPLPPVVVREAALPRRWTVKGLALAVICVVLGGLVVMVGVEAFAKRDAVLVVAKAIPVGSTIDASDVTTASITSDPALRPIPASDRSSVIGKVALVELRPGTLITRDELGSSDGFGSGQVLVPLPLKQDQVPARGLSPGESVMIVATPSATSAGSSVGTPSASGTKAVVTEVGSSDPNTGVTVVDVRVPADGAVALAQLVSTGNAAVLLLPAAG
jgi:hypothetical protein